MFPVEDFSVGARSFGGDVGGNDAVIFDDANAISEKRMESSFSSDM